MRRKKSQIRDVEVPTAPVHVDIPYITFMPTPTDQTVTPEDLLEYIRRKQRYPNEPEGRDTYRFWRWFYPRDRLDWPAPVFRELPAQFPDFNVPDGHPGYWENRQDEWMQDSPVLHQKDLWSRGMARRMSFSRIAHRLEYLMRSTVPPTRGRDGRCGAAILTRQSDKAAGIFHFKVGCREDWSTRGGWLVKFKFLFDEKDVDEETGEPNWRDLDVLVACSCPSWAYGGPQYYALAAGYALDQTPEGARGGDWQNSSPLMKHNKRRFLCKHAIAAGKALLRYI